jgi:ubiquinone/menaquinone biosynthesis C-methylase UbiE
VISNVIHSIVAQPRVYDIVQRVMGLEYTRQRLTPLLAETSGSVVLDVGAGTGLYLGLFPSTAKYIWLDNDRQKLQGFQTRASASIPAVLGDGTRIGLRDKSVDYATCIAVTHHLTDRQLADLVAELGRVIRKKLIFLDALDTSRWQSMLMWKYDRGSHPRSEQTLTAAIEQHFSIEKSETYSVYHHYLLVSAKPLSNP